MNEQQVRWDDLAIVHLPLEPASLQTENWIGSDAHLGDATLEKWMRDKSVAYKLDSMLGMHGAGVAVLPSYLGEAEATLLRLSDPMKRSPSNSGCSIIQTCAMWPECARLWR